MLHGRKIIGTIAYLGGLPAVLEEFAWSLANLVAFSHEELCGPAERIALDRTLFSLHTMARNQLSERFLGDWLLMLDTDHAFEPDLLVRMLHRMNVHGLDVMCGLYLQKQGAHAPVLYGWRTDKLPDGTERGGMQALGGWLGDAPINTVAGAGGGCLLVRRQVYDRLRDEIPDERPFDRIGQGGEDLGFFHRLKRLGIPAWCDRRIECHHLAVQPLSFDEDWHPEDEELVEIDSATGLKPEPQDVQPQPLAPVGA